MQSIAVIDAGSGNLRSVERALEEAARRVNRRREIRVTTDPVFVARAHKIVLPGQGAFARTMAGMTASDGLTEALKEAVLTRGAAFLGICVGLQVLAETGNEFGVHSGLGWFGGACGPLEAGPEARIPHMGWNDVTPEGVPHPVLGGPAVMYFAHSFALPADLALPSRMATTHGTARFLAAGASDNILGVQFHPEKSQDAGIALLSRFLDWTP